MRSGTLTGFVISIPTWNRTRTRTLGEFDAFRYTIGTGMRRIVFGTRMTVCGTLCLPICYRGHKPSAMGRRRDLHPHDPAYKAGAFLSRATSANTQGSGARIRTPSGSFGGCLLSQEHAAVKAPGQ